MKQRFKKGDYICYVDRVTAQSALVDRLPIIQSGYIGDFLPGGYALRNSVIVHEPFVYATIKEAQHEHVTALLQYLKDVSEARDAAIAKLEEYGIEGLDLEDGDLDDALYARKQVEHIRSIPEDKRTPEMEALIWAVEHPSVEDP